MNLTEWPHEQGIHVTTVYRWYREGALPVPARKAGRLQAGLAAGTGRGRVGVWINGVKAVGYVWRAIGPLAVLRAGNIPCGGGG